jgi:hypothetical protein
MDRSKPSVSRRIVRVFPLAALLGIMVCGLAAAVEPKAPGGYLDQKEFFKPELALSSSHAPLERVLRDLPNRAAWESFRAARGNAGEAPAHVSIDPRSGAAASVVAPFPLLPGRGAVDGQTVAEAARRFVQDHRELLGIDATQLGATRAAQVTSELWQISIPQTYKGIPVRYGRVAATLSHGNLVVVGTETWGDVRGLSPVPKIDGAAALAAGFAYAGGRSALDEILREPALEVVPVAPQEFQGAQGFAGPVGVGYRHRLVWTFLFQRVPEDAVWEAMVDAHSGEVLSFQDTNQHVNQGVTGGVYPIANTEICPDAATCGTMQTGSPMPFANTGLAAPNDFTNSAGIVNYTGGTVTTTLTGRYVGIADTCGAITNSAAGALDLAGTNGQHDCTTAGGSAGNTPASRTAFYEVNKLAEMARGWLPNNTWLKNRLTTNVNLNNTCNAFWNGSSINFYRSGGGCRNTGEIAGVFDHEWGHGLDDNDAIGSLSSSSEGYADIAAIYRLQTSCLGHGFFWTSDKGCGQTADGTGFNQNEAQTGASHCDLNCSGVRDADWDRHADHTPDTPLGFVCTSCLTGTGPCGRQVHCSAAPSRQAAWDLVARDLQSAPFGLDRQTAFIVGAKLFFQGSGNIGAWHSCTCGGSADGCGASNGYMQWLTADDDNGNLNDGTPHMTAIFNAFNRHGIACATPAPVNSGCGGGPTAATTLSGSGGDFQSSLSWTSVPGATRYWVFRTEGHAGCDFGKALIAETTGTAFTDTAVANGREYSYNVVAAGSSSACFGVASNCLAVTPAGVPPVPDFAVSCSPSSLTVTQGGAGASACTVTSLAGFNGAVSLSCIGQPAGVTCGFATNPVTPPANGSAGSALTVSVSGATAAGTYNFQVQGTDGSLIHGTSLALTVPASCVPVGGSCTISSQCCSNNCKGKAGAKTCK